MTRPGSDSAWFHNAIIDGVQLLYSLALNGSPAAEVLPLTTTGWVEVLWRGSAWDAQRDSDRVRLAFFSLARVADRWPAPKALLDHLPPVEPVRALTESVPEPSPAQRAALQALKRRLHDRLTATPQARAVRPDTLECGDLRDDAGAGMVPPNLQAPTDRAASLDQIRGPLS